MQESKETGEDLSHETGFTASNSLKNKEIDVSKHIRPVHASDLWSLGITIVVGGQYFGWNAGLSAGFGSYAIIQVLVGLAYICLILCTSEITSGLPFAGGVYGLGRLSLGFYPGFIVGCSEAMEYIFYTATSTYSLGILVLDALSIDIAYGPLVWALFYMSALYIHIHGGSLFWNTTHVLTFLSLGILIVYILGSLAFVDFNQNARYVTVNDDSIQNPPYFIGGGYQFMSSFFLASWSYVGVESLAFASDLVVEPKKALPLGSISCTMTLAVTSIFVLFVCSSLPSDGVSSTAASLAPFNVGFKLMFGISDRVAYVFSMPATYATAFGFMFPSGKLLESLSESNLLPEPLRRTTARSKTPYVALIFGAVIGFALNVFVLFVPSFLPLIFNICILSGFVGYVSQCYGYIIVVTKFQSIDRSFHSPLGIFGAVYAAIIFIIGALSVIAFQEDNQIVLIFVLVVQILFSIYYFNYAKSRQTFSPDESKVMFRAHVISHNQHANHNGKRKTKPGTSNIHSNMRNSENSLGNHIPTGTQGSHAKIVPLNLRLIKTTSASVLDNKNHQFVSVVHTHEFASIIDADYPPKMVKGIIEHGVHEPISCVDEEAV